MNCEICRWWTVVVHGGLRSVFHFTDRPSRSFLILSWNRNLSCIPGGLRPWFTGRKSLYGPSTRSYLTILGCRMPMAVYDRRFTGRIALYGPYLVVYDHWAVFLPTSNFSHSRLLFYSFPSICVHCPWNIIHLSSSLSSLVRPIAYHGKFSEV